MLTIIVAYDENRGIGYQNQLPWPPIHEDWKHFKKTTLNSTVIMGRNTWESLPKKPLPNRRNIVISTTLALPEVESYRSLEDALDHIKPIEGCFLIGGGQLYEYAIKNNFVKEILASEINGAYPSDTFFPEINKWQSRVLKTFNDFKVVKYNLP